MVPQSESDITYIARTNFHNGQKRFGIKRADRRAHMYLIGKTGVGKSTLLESLIRQDIERGEGVAVFDPHGDLVTRVHSSLPVGRTALFLNLSDPALAVRFNPFAGVAPEKRPLASANLVEIFKKIWADSWGPRLEHLMRNAFLVLLDYPGGTLADIPRLLEDKTFRLAVVGYATNEQVRTFWQGEYERYPPAMRAQVTAPVENKVGAFLSDPRVLRLVSGPGESLKVRELMDAGGVLLVNLSKGELGEGPASLLGSLIVASIGLAGLARTELPPEKRRDFYVYLDEFHAFATLSLAGMLSELRKYRVNLILAHQYFSQVDTTIRDAVLGNVGTLICFRVGAQDAPLLSREFAPEFGAEDLLRLPNFNVYLRLMVDGSVSRPFSAETLGV